MYGDTEVMRHHARQLREQATDVRSLADRLVTSTESLGWSGRAAASMRERVTDRATHLRGAAARHETAADALEKHLHEIDRHQEAIAETERKATTLVADARERVARVEQAREAGDSVLSDLPSEPDPDDVTLVAFDPPPSGHRDWLGVQLPGL